MFKLRAMYIWDHSCVHTLSITIDKMLQLYIWVDMLVIILCKWRFYSKACSHSLGGCYIPQECMMQLVLQIDWDLVDNVIVVGKE